MRNVALLVLTVAVFALTTGRRMFRKCTFCRFFFETGNSPYELLWVLREEISSYLSEDQIITLLLDEDDLIKAELVFELYCERTCNNSRASKGGSPLIGGKSESGTPFAALHKMAVARRESSGVTSGRMAMSSGHVVAPADGETVNKSGESQRELPTAADEDEAIGEDGVWGR